MKGIREYKRDRICRTSWFHLFFINNLRQPFKLYNINEFLATLKEKVERGCALRLVETFH